mmetsp:Transcript_107/g.196  ORF Transcript_107/g.196 Transcript_107/m.196 type:complete len:260 (-) Transcript_107:921-1700(-)
MEKDRMMERQSLLAGDRDHSRGLGTSGGSLRTDSRALIDLHDQYVDDRASREVAWLRRCLPIIVQPKVDIGNGYGLVRLFFNFRQDIANPADLICELELVFEGEGSYHKAVPMEHNELVSCCYRAKNLFQFGRTGDINHIQFRGVKLTGDGLPWRSMFTVDHCADQTWASGNGGDCFSWCSIMKHYQREVRSGSQSTVTLTTSPSLSALGSACLLGPTRWTPSAGRGGAHPRGLRVRQPARAHSWGDVARAQSRLVSYH